MFASPLDHAGAGRDKFRTSPRRAEGDQSADSTGRRARFEARTTKYADNGSAVITYGPGERIIVPLRPAVAGGVGDTIELSVRPEKIDMSTTAPTTADRCVVGGVVTEVIYLGTSTNYNVTTTSGAEIVVFDQNAASAEDIAVRGDHVFLSWNPQHSYPIGA